MKHTDPIAFFGRLRDFARLSLTLIYERRLNEKILRDIIPQHIGIILDGNRRSAKAAGISDNKAIYQRGASKLTEVLGWCGDLGVKAVTAWVLSTDNLSSRSAEDLASLLEVLESRILALARSAEVKRHGIRIRALGQLNLLPPAIAARIRAVEAETANNRSMTLTIAIAYGGREEITDAVTRFLMHEAASGHSVPEIARSLTPERLGHYLNTLDAPEPELIIRTSGELRLSGFLLWQSAYSELYFTDVYWPEFRKIDLLRAIRSYQQRQRRFGK